MPKPSQGPDLGHRQVSDKDIPAPTEIVSLGLDYDGSEIDIASPVCVCKQTTAQGMPTRFWVKASTTGHDCGRLLNPQDPMFEAPSARGLAKILGRSTYEFKSVTEESFLHYVKFLKTKNVTHLRHAEWTASN